MASRTVSSSSRQLRVALVWNGALHAEQILAEGAAVILGGKDSTFLMPESDGSTEAVKLLTPTEKGYELRVLPGLGGDVWIGGKRGTIKRLREKGHERIPLGPDDFGVVTHGQFAFFFQYVKRANAPKRPLFSLELALVSTILLSFFGHAALLGFAFLADKERDTLADGELALEQVRRFMVTPPPVEEEPPPPPDDAPEEPTKVEKQKQTVTERPQRRPPPEPDRISKRLRETLQNIQNQQPETTRAQSLVRALITNATGERASVTNIMQNVRVTSANATGVSGIASALGTIPTNVGIQTGGGGPISTVGGAAATKNVGNLQARANGPVRGAVRGVQALVRQTGGQLDRASVLEVINRSLGRIQQCYERALSRSPGLAGRITFEWVISPTGTVGNARQRDSTIGDANVSTCILGIIRGMRFPRPTGGSVNIAYPFLFQAQR